MRSYPFAEIESKWRKKWAEEGLYTTNMQKIDKKCYCLVMFIYTSGDKMHIGHWYNYGPTDTWARFKLMQGYNVFEPIGYDAFGLPAENYAIKEGVHPAISTAENISFIREQLKVVGAMYDWSKEIDTSSPKYYKWTQWLFLQLYHQGLAYRKKAPVNWCPSCQTVLANEQVIDGRCERCDSEVTKRDLKQWFLKITDYAERLLEGLDRIDWPEKTKIMQRNWIGKSVGAEIDFKLAGGEDSLPVFTTRPDTLYGATYLVLAPEHPLVETLTVPSRRKEVAAYIEKTKRESEIERTSLEKEKAGVFTGGYAVNPINGGKIPIWISDYVLLTYGTGAVMAVPAHDQRDYEFALKFNLPVRWVIRPADGELGDRGEAFVEYGVMFNSKRFDGLPSEVGGKRVVEALQERHLAKPKVNYRLRDWLISRQRYWGAPIPIVYCEKCGEVPVQESDLPVKLPFEVDFKPTGTGESPLTTSPEFVQARCPRCGGPARREVDTMDTFVCSSWYYLRYPNPNCADRPFDSELVSKWLPVDQYVGGAEHAVMHLLYARFITKVLYDKGLINFDEPFLKLRHQGIITRAGAKMSKSKGNVVRPEEYIAEYGSDSFRMYLMFMGNFELGGDWDSSGINGVFRFLNRVYRLIDGKSFQQNEDFKPTSQADKALWRKLNYTIKRCSQDLEEFHFNTAIASLMELVNNLYSYPHPQSTFFAFCLQRLLLLLAPFAPHLCEELWHRTGGDESIFLQPWPTYNPEALKQEEITVVIQVNGKLRSEIRVSPYIEEEELKEMVVNDKRVKGYVRGNRIARFIIVPRKLVNLVVR